MLLAGWLVWRSVGLDGAAFALSIYAIHLLLNGLWSVVFFGLRRPDLAFLEVMCLWLSIVVTMLAFFKIEAASALILIPYLLWVSFAAALNYRVWRLNSERFSS